MASPYIGEIILFGGNFAPKGYAECKGQLMLAAQNAALFTLIGNIYGGNAQQGTFALPDMRSRIVIGQGQAPGLAKYSMGQTGGTESVTLTVQQLPVHNHAASVTSTATASTPATNTIIANETQNPPNAALAYAPFNAGTQVALAPASVALAGKNQPHPNVQPILAMKYCIALSGAVPVKG